MASLSFIMDVDVDHPDVSTHENKRDMGSFATPPASHAPDTSARQGHAPTPGQDDERSPGLPKASTSSATRANTTTSDATATIPVKEPPPPVTGENHAGSLEGTPRSPAATSPSSRGVLPRRRSSTSPGSMDHHAYVSPTSIGAGRGAGMEGARGGSGGHGGMGVIGGGMGSSNHPMRPMVPHTPTESPVRLTPITGRISRAKKGQPVHVCELCKPPKTFTRAEHLRRHQLSHKTPGFPCTYPGCDRAFHRQDLLVRHQTKHDQEGAGASSSRGGGQHRRAVSAPTLDVTSGLSLPQPGAPSAMPGSGPGSGVGASTPVSACDVPSTPNIANTMLQSVGSSPGDVRGSGPSDHSMDAPGASYERSSLSRQSHDFGSTYVLSPSASSNPVLQYATASTSLDSSSLTTPTAFSHIDYQQQQPRSQHHSLFVVTEGLPGPPHPTLQISDGGIPELIQNTDLSMSSPWESSPDSSYSTPSDSRSHQHLAWIQRQGSPRNDWLSPYPATSARETLPMDAIAGPYLISQFPQSPHPLVSPHPVYSPLPGTPSHHTYGVLDVMGSFSAEDPSQAIQQVMGARHGSAAVSSGDAGLRNSMSMSSIRSPSPVISTSAGAVEPLLTPSTTLPSDRIGRMTSRGRQKEVMVTDASAMAIAASMGGNASLLSTSTYGLSGGGGGDCGSPGGGRCLPGQGLGRMGGCLSGPVSSPGPLSRPIRNAIPTYLDSYWNNFHAVYPLTHRRLTEEAGEDVLRCVMAAVGTQLLDSKEDRNKGNMLHDYASNELRSIPRWNLQIMQAVILCEYFSRFRGRRSATRPTNQFESLYWRAIDQLPSLFDHAPTAQDSPHLTTDQRWRAWADAEARRRLLSACFVLDVHTSIYHGHPRVRDFNLSEPGNVPPIPLIGRSRALWDAQSPEEWDSLLNEDPEAGIPLFLPHPDTLTPMVPEEGSASGCQGLPLNLFDRLAILAFEACRLPKRTVAGSGGSNSSDGDSPTPVADDKRQADGDWSGLDDHLTGAGSDAAAASDASAVSSDAEDRISRLFPGCPVANTYLAIHHTPLHDLLAVSGDGSMSHRTPERPFQEIQNRVRLWKEQGQGSSIAAASAGLKKSVVRATMYAARALLAFLDPDSGAHAPGDGTWVSVCKLSDYWAMYVCALICWGWVQHPAKSGQGASSTPTDPSANSRGIASDGEALEWLRSAAATQPDDKPAWARLRGSREVRAIVGLVRRRLELDLVGVRSQRVYSDTVKVLADIENGTNWTWI